MGLRIEDQEVEALVAEVARITGESETETVRRAMAERRLRLEAGAPPRGERDLRRVLETEIWPAIPEDVRGHTLSKREREAILGYGPDGV